MFARIQGAEAYEIFDVVFMSSVFCNEFLLR